MKIAIQPTQKQTRGLSLTPHLQQAIRLLEFSNIGLSKYLEDEVEQNPFLELKYSSNQIKKKPQPSKYKGSFKKYSFSQGKISKSSNSINNIGYLSRQIDPKVEKKENLRDHLTNQLNMEIRNVLEKKVGQYIIDRIDDVAPVGRQLHPIDCLSIVGARLGVLAGHSAHADDRDARAPREHEAHLQKNLQLRLDGRLGAVGKALGAIAALQEECLTARRLREMPAQGIHLAVMDQRRQCAHLSQGNLQRGGIGIPRLLPDGALAPVGGRPAGRVGMGIAHKPRLYRHPMGRARLNRALIPRAGRGEGFVRGGVGRELGADLAVGAHTGRIKDDPADVLEVGAIEGDGGGERLAVLLVAQFQGAAVELGAEEVVCDF